MRREGRENEGERRGKRGLKDERMSVTHLILCARNHEFRNSPSKSRSRCKIAGLIRGDTCNFAWSTLGNAWSGKELNVDRMPLMDGDGGKSGKKEAIGQHSRGFETNLISGGNIVQ